MRIDSLLPTYSQTNYLITKGIIVAVKVVDRLSININFDKYS